MTDEKKPGLGSRVRGLFNTVKTVTLDAIARFKSEDNREIDFSVDFGTDTVWATQAQIADLFGTTKQNVSLHLRNLYKEGELDEDAVSKESLVTASDGKSYRTPVYNLDAILAVGYRVSGKRATAFRKWATTVLKGYIEDGYALNGRRLEQDPVALRNLAQQVRAIRTSEKQLYEQVKETFVACSIDYDKTSDEARKFFATCQDKFHWAVSEKTSAQIVLTRADGTKPAMGMTAIGNKMPTLAEAKIGKNYLEGQELRSMEILGEQWLLYAEGMAQRGKAVSMSRLLEKLDEIIELNEYSAFPGHEKIGSVRAAADAHAKAQLDLFRKSNSKGLAPRA